MRLSLRPWQFSVLAFALFALLIGAYWVWRTQPATNAAGLSVYRPGGDGPILFVDFAHLRRLGIVDRIAGSRGSEEPDYHMFVEASGFDYRAHLDQALVIFRERSTFFLVTGKFDWTKLTSYTRAHAGSCLNARCSMPASLPDRFISFMPLRNRSLALGVSDRREAVSQVSGPARPPLQDLPNTPIWVYLPADWIRSASVRSPQLEIILKQLAGATRVWLTVEFGGGGATARLRAETPSASAASRIHDGLNAMTRQLRDSISASKEKVPEGTLAAVLCKGSFRLDGAVTLAEWPLNAAFLESLGGV